MRPGLRIRIGDLGHARVGREAHRDRHLVLEMQRLAHARRLRARNELTEQDDALGVGRPLRRLLAERRVERIDERFGGRGHRGLLPCVHRRPPLERSLPPSKYQVPNVRNRSTTDVARALPIDTLIPKTRLDETADGSEPKYEGRFTRVAVPSASPC